MLVNRGQRFKSAGWLCSWRCAVQHGTSRYHARVLHLERGPVPCDVFLPPKDKQTYKQKSHGNARMFWDVLAVCVPRTAVMVSWVFANVRTSSTGIRVLFLVYR